MKSHCWTSWQWHPGDQSVITFENWYNRWFF